MSALILKDLYIMKKYCRSVLLMVVIFWGPPIPSATIKRFGISPTG